MEEVESGSWLTTGKKTVLQQSYADKKLNYSENENELGSEFFPRASRWELSPAATSNFMILWADNPAAEFPYF